MTAIGMQGQEAPAGATDKQPFANPNLKENNQNLPEVEETGRHVEFVVVLGSPRMS